MRKVLLAVGVPAIGLVSSAAQALTYTDAVTDATTEVTAAMTAALPIGALVLASVVGWKLFKRFARG